jgi:hypothetical protein
MKLCVAPWCVVLLSLLPGHSPAAVETQRDFNVEVVAEGRWYPRAVDWDAAGRMWLATSPHQGSARGSIVVFEKGNLLPRKFYTGPAINGFVFHGDGIIAGTGSGAVWLRDKNGDGSADTVEPLFSSGPLTNLRSGLDGWIYACAAERDRGVSRLVRFKPKESSFQTLATVPGVPVGFDLSWERELFFSQPQGAHLSHVGLFQRYLASGGISNAATYRKVEDHARTWGRNIAKRADVRRVASVNASVAPAPSFTAATPKVSFERVAGLCIYEGGAWPERFHGNSYVCDPDLHVVHEDVISRAESAYFEGTQRTAAEFLTGSDSSFRPHMVRYGPDGALYVLGSDEPVEVMAATGRSAGLLHALPDGYVWRVHHKNPRPINGIKLVRASTEGLARSLEHANGWVRQMALRLLIEEHGASAMPHLTNLLFSSRVAPARVAAVWGLQRLGALTIEVWTNAIADYHSAVQKSAWLAFAESPEPVTREIEKLAEKHVKEAEERVCIAILMALSKGPLTPDGRKMAAKLFPDLKDVWSKSVLLTIGRETPLEFLKVAFASDKSEHFRELAVLLVEQIAGDKGDRQKVEDLVAKSDPEKTEKLTATVKEALAKARKL